ncbi:MAG: hypothetical protein ACI4I9_08845 [Porcipelethomonas sp.]
MNINDLYVQLLKYKSYIVNGTACCGLVPLKFTEQFSEIGFITFPARRILYLGAKRENACPCSEWEKISDISMNESDFFCEFMVVYDDGGRSVVKAFK